MRCVCSMLLFHLASGQNRGKFKPFLGRKQDFLVSLVILSAARLGDNLDAYAAAVLQSSRLLRSMRGHLPSSLSSSFLFSLFFLPRYLVTLWSQGSGRPGDRPGAKAAAVLKLHTSYRYMPTIHPVHSGHGFKHRAWLFHTAGGGRCAIL
jgi:hypothetical protein